MERSLTSQDAETGRREIRKSGSTETKIGAPAVSIRGAEVLEMRSERAAKRSRIAVAPDIIRIRRIWHEVDVGVVSERTCWVRGCSGEQE